MTKCVKNDIINVCEESDERTTKMLKMLIKMISVLFGSFVLNIDDDFISNQQLRTFEYVKQKVSSGNKEFAAISQKMNLQTRT